jgi:hypothetical protein
VGVNAGATATAAVACTPPVFMGAATACPRSTEL